MTAPAEPTADVTELVKQLKGRAVELGIAWSFVTATMTSDTMAQIDGDTVPTAIISVSGAHTAGTRVGVIKVPPAGQYVIGVVGASEPSQVVARDTAVCTTLAALTTTPTAMTGATATVTAPSDVYYEVTGFWDLESSVAGASVGQGYLYIDGVQQTGQALLSLATVCRGTVGQQWSGTLSAGDHTFDMYAGKSAAAATGRINAVHSNIRITFYA